MDVRYASLPSVNEEQRTAAALCYELDRRGVRLWADRDDLHYRAHRGVLTDNDRTTIRRNKAALITVLRPLDGRAVESIWPPTVAQTGFVREGEPKLIMKTTVWRAQLDIEAFRDAVQLILQRHSVLRTRYIFDADDRIWAITEGRSSIPVQEIDLSTLDSELQERATWEFVRCISEERVNLRRGPLCRVTAIKLGRARFVIALGMHHSIGDELSYPILGFELGQLYESVRLQRQTALPALRAQYSEFARWQHEWLRSKESRVHVEYWKKTFAGAESPFWLPRDEQRDVAEADDAPSDIGGRVSGNAARALRELSERRRTTLFTFAVAAFGVVLADWSQREQVYMWVCHSGRSRAEYVRLIGCFMGLWPLCVDLTGDPTFYEVVSRVNTAYLEALPHMEMPARHYVGEVARTVKGQLHPAILFNYISGTVRSTRAGRRSDTSATETSTGRRYRSARFENTSQHALGVTVRETTEGLRWSMHHASHLFADATVNRVSQTYARVLSDGARNPNFKVSALLDSSTGVHGDRSCRRTRG